MNTKKIICLLLILFLFSCTNDTVSSESPKPEETEEAIEPEIYIAPTVKIISVSAGENHTLALDDKGQVWAWGDNLYGQVGDGNFTNYLDFPQLEPEDEYYYDENINRRKDIDNDVYTPKLIMDNVKEIFARAFGSFAITNDNKLYAWGKNDLTPEINATPTYIMDDVLYVDSSYNYNMPQTFIIKTDNTLWFAGPIGFLNEGTFYSEPVCLYENVKKAVFDDSWPTGIVILTTDNRLISYAPEVMNSNNFIFKEITGLNNVVDISAGAEQVYTLNTSGEVYGWGANGYEGRLGAMGDIYWIDEPIFIAADIKKILHGQMFITNENTLLVWGTIYWAYDSRTTQGQVGAGITDELIVYGKTPVEILNNIAIADGRRFHFIAVNNDGIVYTWGNNFYGQLGNGTSEDIIIPTPIIFP
ncbi:MAG: hypothetical protein FWF15_06340 [Oscillospiraceae bacterium]|nr:hypothetical protein [Oscillospiraceae bacterium]